MRILFVTFSTVPFGSNDLLWYRAAERAIDKGHDVVVSVCDWSSRNSPKYATLAKKGAVIDYRPSYERRLSFLARQWDRVWDKLGRDRGVYWRRLFSRVGPDVVVACAPDTYHFATPGGFVDYWNDRSLPFVTISQLNSEAGSLRSPVYRRARPYFQKAEACVFVSQRNLEVARRQLCLALPNAVVLDNPPDLEDCSYIAFPSEETCSLAAVARLECGVKGQDLLLQALSQPRWRARDWHCSIVGDGPDKGYLADLIRFLDLSDRVRLLGHIPNVRDVWKNHALLLMCSLAEGKPLALTEAMYCGRPAVVTDVGGNGELIQEGRTGFLAESATVQNFANALERAWLARDRWQAMGLEAHHQIHLRQETPPEKRLLDVIESVTAHDRPIEPFCNGELIGTRV
jgi:glycosyltransferase involved in cell wall biosynthesis